MRNFTGSLTRGDGNMMEENDRLAHPAGRGRGEIPVTQKPGVRNLSMSATLKESVDELAKRLLAQQPDAKASLERLIARFGAESERGPFAPIRNGRCCACNLTVAAVRLQKARNRGFINCANCSRFLYLESD
ncbi:MAG: hypothetical protein AB1631_16350 [Acidobacteriota bacterium]